MSKSVAAVLVLAVLWATQAGEVNATVAQRGSDSTPALVCSGDPASLGHQCCHKADAETIVELAGESKAKPGDCKACGKKCGCDKCPGKECDGGK